MTEKEFSSAFRRGLGSAIVEIENAKDKSKFRDIVLRYCLRNIAYDWQCEGTKGDYLYCAICNLGEEKSFEPIIIERFLSKCSHMLFIQLSRILYLCADNGSFAAKEAFLKKYDYFISKGGHFSQNTHESLQWDDLVINLFYLYGFSMFKKYLQNLGELLCKKPDNIYEFTDWDWILHLARKKFGQKRVDEYIDQMYESSSNVKIIIDTVKANELSREKHKINIEKVSVDKLIAVAKEAAPLDYPRGKVIHFQSWVVTKASETEILELAEAALAEQDETVKALLLLMFKYKRIFPLDISHLMEYAWSDNELLSGTAIECLENFKDKRIHDLAVQLLNDRGLKSMALGLLRKNYRKSDDDLIYRLVKSPKTLPHFVPSDIASIYTHNRSENAFPALYHAYKKGECSFCREGVVRAMQHCGVLSDKLLNECLYDSYDDTREFAKRIERNRHKN